MRLPNAYYVGVILSNYVIDYYEKNAYDYYLYMIENWKETATNLFRLNKGRKKLYGKKGYKTLFIKCRYWI